MRKSILGLSAVAFAMLATPAFADEAADPLGLKVTGNVAGVSDYRFRGFSQSSEDPAVQGGITVTHTSGLYVGTWASSISFAGNTEVDLFAGYSKEVVPGITVDGGLLFYLYPQHNKTASTNYFEPYLNVIGTYGPATLKVGVNYAWEQSALLGIRTNSDLGQKVSSIYFHAEPSVTIPNTPFGLNAHIGYAESDSFLGGFGEEGKVIDYSVGATATWKNLTFGVSYVDTDEASVRTTGIGAGLGAEAIGADGAAVFSLTATF
jgi:uncharacterized protein (TIGR02001 family)